MANIFDRITRGLSSLTQIPQQSVNKTRTIFDNVITNVDQGIKRIKEAQAQRQSLQTNIPGRPTLSTAEKMEDLLGKKFNALEAQRISEQFQIPVFQRQEPKFKDTTVSEFTPTIFQKVRDEGVQNITRQIVFGKDERARAGGIVGGVRDVGAGATSGLLNIAAGVVDFFEVADNMVSELTGQTPIGRSVQETPFMKRAVEEGKRKKRPEPEELPTRIISDSLRNLSQEVNKAADNEQLAFVGNVAGSVLASIGAFALTRDPKLSISVFGSSQAGSQFRAATNAGMSSEDATRVGIASGLTEGILEGVGLDNFVRFGGGGLFKSIVKGAIAEAPTEAAQQFTENYISRETFDPNRKLGDNLIESIIGGLLGGGFGGAVTFTSGSPIYQVRDQEIQNSIIDNLKVPVEQAVQFVPVVREGVQKGLNKLVKTLDESVLSEKVLQTVMGQRGAAQLGPKGKRKKGKAVKKKQVAPVPPSVQPQAVPAQKVNVKVTEEIVRPNEPIQKKKDIEDHPEEIEVMRESVNKGTLHTSVKTGKPVTKRNLKKETEDLIARQNQKIDDQRVREIREENLLNPETIDEIIARKRGIITDMEAVERAKSIRVNTDDILNLPKGTTLNKEQITALNQVVQNERDVNKKLRELVEKGGASSTQEERTLIERELGQDFSQMPEGDLLNAALAESTIKLKRLEMIALGVGSEAGRSLQGLKQTVSGIDARMRAIFSRLKNKTELEQQAILEKIAEFPIENEQNFIDMIEKLDQPDIFDKIAEWITAIKLYAPTTHIVNLGSNALRQMVDIGTTAIAEPSMLAADLSGAIVGTGKGLKNAFRALTDEGYAQQLSKYIEEGGQAPAIKGVKGKVIRTSFRLLSAGDEIFRAIGHQRSLYRQARTQAKQEGLKGKDLDRRMEEILSKPTFDMQEKAMKESKRLTFQKEMPKFFKMINKLRTPSSFKNKGAKAASLFVRQFLLFLKTPVNLFEQSVDLSPTGLIKNVDWSKGNTIENRRAFAEVMIGSALIAFIMDQALKGNITGGAPEDKNERDQFYREEKVPYGIKIGDKWYSYQRIDPFSTVMGFTADMTLNWNETDGRSIGTWVGHVSEQLRDKTFLRGMEDMTNLLMGESWERERVLKNIVVGTLLPSISGAVARTVDPVVRESRDASVVEMLQMQIPFLSKRLPAKVDALGNEIERANLGLNYLFNPIQTGEIGAIDPVTSFLMRTGTIVKLPSRSFTRDGVKIELSREEYEQYSKVVGNRIAEQIMIEEAGGLFKGMEQEEVQEIIDEIRDEVQKEEKDLFVERNADRFEEARARQEKQEAEERRRVIESIPQEQRTVSQAVELSQPRTVQTGNKVEEFLIRFKDRTDRQVVDLLRQSLNEGLLTKEQAREIAEKRGLPL